jgi:hypothetical protein
MYIYVCGFSMNIGICHAQPKLILVCVAIYVLQHFSAIKLKQDFKISNVANFLFGVHSMTPKSFIFVLCH